MTDSAANTVCPSPDRLSRVPDRVLVLIAAAIAVMQTGGEWFEAYAPGIDESWMLQAGTRLAAGQGLTTAQLDDWSDLAHPRYAHLQYWPPLHSWVYAGLVALAGGTAGAMAGLKVLKFLAAFAGVLGWLRLGRRVLPTPALGLYALGLVGVFFASGAEAAASHMFFWAIMPWFLSALLTGVSPVGTDRHLLTAGVLAAFAVAYRYHGAYIIPGGAAAVVFLSHGPLVRRLLRAALVAAPPTLALGGILLYNASQNGPSSWVAELPPQWNIDNVLRRQPLTFLFAFGFGLEETVLKVKPSAAAWPFAVYLPWYGLLGATAAAAVVRLRGRLTAGFRRLAFVAGLMALGLIALLAAISYRAEALPGWVPIGSYRLYGELLPAVGLVWVALMAAWWNREWFGVPPSGGLVGVPPSGGILGPRDGVTPTWPRVVVIGLAAAAVGLECRFAFRAAKANVRRALTALRDGPGGEPALAAEVRRLLAAAPTRSHRVFDAYHSCVNRLRADDMHVHRFDWVGKLAKCGTTEPAYVVVVVRRKTDPDGGAMDTFWADTYGNPFADFLGLPAAGEVVDGDETCTLRAGVVAPFRPGDRPLPKTE